MTRRTLAVLAAAAITLLALALPDKPATSAPVATDDTTYEQCGRVFPDPHAFRPAPAPAPGQSPWAKGNAACRAVDFLGWEETIAGLRYLEARLPSYVEVYDLSDPAGPLAAALDFPAGDGMSAGLPTEALAREKQPMHLVRVTDEASTAIPIGERRHFAFGLSIHGIERAGVEGGVRAIEDLATWAACEASPNAVPACAAEGPFPHPIMETIPAESIGAGEALRTSSLWFAFANPDGWRRGDKASGGFYYQRYNGNGMDLNRDWPSVGYTYRPFTPHSEPETRTIGRALERVKPTWTGGIDLHGQLLDRAFSFTMLRGTERPFDEDRRVLQYVKGAWADAEQRLAWSPAIKPNDAPPACFDPLDPGPPSEPGCDPSGRVYGVQWGTTWDSIGYTTTGSFGDWMDSELGLGGAGIDNEMSLSHVSNCGTGTCYLADFEQLHVDGNKSLIYAMVHYSLVPEDTSFRYDGKAAWLHHDNRIAHAGTSAPTTPPGLAPQDGFDVDMAVLPTSPSVHEFDVRGPEQGVSNGAISVTLTSNNLGAVSPGAALEVAVDRFGGDEADPNAPDEGWAVQNSYYNQSPTYLQAGARVDVNSPEPGRFRVRLEGQAAGLVHVEVRFLSERAWPDPGQLPYDVSNLDFFRDLQPFAPAGALQPAPIERVVDGSFDLSSIDSLVIADGAFLPGFDPMRRAAPQSPVSTSFTMSPALGAPGVGGFRGEGQASFHEFDVEAGHSSLQAALDAPSIDQAFLYLQRRLPDGTWSEDLADSSADGSGREVLTYDAPAAGRYRVEAFGFGGSPGPATLAVSFEVPPAASSAFDAADERVLLDRLRTFVTSGGNLVLTDDAFRVLERLELLPAGSVRRETVYAGFVEFLKYDDPLAANIQQAGAAEGPSHRHQISEPVPLGFEIFDADGDDRSTMRQFVVDRPAWEAAGGRSAGVANGQVTFGELTIGEGQVRVLGSLLPRPAEQYDHPYGLSSHAITYSGYEAFRNMLDISTRVIPGPLAAGAGGVAAPLHPATGDERGAAGGAVALAVLAGLALLVATRLAGRRGS